MGHPLPLLPPPTVPSTISARSALSGTPSSKVETATFAAGCFWGTEHLFRSYYNGRGLIDARVGYTGGDVQAREPDYKTVCSGTTGHAEAVRVTYDPGLVGYAELVEFFYRTHDPTTLNRQGRNSGTSYRSAIFYHTASQQQVAEEVTKEVEEKHFKPKGQEIVTLLVEAGEWWNAEEYHQEYLDKNPDGYHCVTHKVWW